MDKFDSLVLKKPQNHKVLLIVAQVVEFPLEGFFPADQINFC